MDYIFSWYFVEDAKTIPPEDAVVPFLWIVVISIAVGFLYLLWSWTWPKIKAFWSFMIPYTLAFILLRVIENKIYSGLSSMFYTFLETAHSPVCQYLPYSFCFSLPGIINNNNNNNNSV